MMCITEALNGIIITRNDIINTCYNISYITKTNTINND